MPERPVGVIIICILQFIGAILMIIMGALVGILGAGYGSGLAFITGVAVLAIGIVLIFATLALWALKSWGWWVSIILNILIIVTGAVGGLWIGLIIPIITIIYLVVIREHFR